MLDYNGVLRICLWTLLTTVKVGCYQMVDLDDDGMDDIEEDQEGVFHELDCSERETGRLEVECWVDGRSHLVIRGDELWLEHFDFVAPGRHGGEKPTRIDGEEWWPTWTFDPDPDDGTHCGGCRTEDSWTLEDPFPEEGEVAVKIDVVESRSSTTLVQRPSASNDYTTVVEWDDNPPGGPAWYVTTISWARCAEGAETDAGQAPCDGCV